MPFTSTFGHYTFMCRLWSNCSRVSVTKLYNLMPAIVQQYSVAGKVKLGLLESNNSQLQGL